MLISSKIKYCTLIIPFLIFSTECFSQEIPAFAIGSGLPFFININSGKNQSDTHNIESARIHIFIEKGEMIHFPGNPEFSITPGAGYFLFNESKISGGLGAGGSRYYKHQALSFYTKWLYDPGSNPEKVFDFYGGVVSGFYFLSKTTGTEYWYNSFQPYGNSTIEINRSGKNFFHSLYMGFVFGFKPIVKPGSFVKPRIEFSFLPGYAAISNPSQSSGEQKVAKSMTMFSVIIGFGHKKKLLKNE